MKKFFTLTMLLVLALTVNAQQTYRKSWDFTKWSAATVANLKAEAAKSEVKDMGGGKTQLVDDHGALWSDHEKAVGKDCTSYGASQGGKCFWATSNNNVGGDSLIANGELIPEFVGLYFNKSYTSARSLAIGVDYNTGGYNGASYLWFGSNKKDLCVIRGVAPGTTIKMGVESHKTSEARGIELYLVKNATTLTHGTKLKSPDGVDVAIPTTYQDLEWLLPTEDNMTDADKAMANEDGTYNVLLYNTNGCHVYYITVGEGDAPAVEDAKNVAYVGSGDDMALNMFDPSVVAATAVETVPTLEALQENYDALVVSPSATAEQLAAVKDIVAFFPVVNTNPTLYSLYDVVTTEGEDLTITDATNAIFGEKDAIEHTGAIMAVALSGYFENDQVLATSGSNAAIHVHNAGRNAYYYIPLAADEGNQDLYDVLSNAIVAASKTKRAVTAVGTPKITFKQEDGKSIVTITATNAKTIYYTTDGSTPSNHSTVYTEPFTVTEETPVRAVAFGDGYTPSDGVSVQVTIATKLAMPTIAITREAGQSTVTITAAEGAKVYYSFNADGVKKSAESTAYTEPVVVTEPTNIYAFAEAEGKLASDATEMFVGVDGFDASNIRMDVIAHFDANETDWFINNAEILPNQSGGASAYYFWGKSAWNYYSTEVDHEETVKDSEGNDSIVYYYKPDPEALRVVNPLNDNGWVIKSQGQTLTGELQLAPSYAVGNGATGRYAEEATDLLPAGVENTITKGVLTFGGKNSGEPYTGRIETSGKIAGPFDVVVYCGNGNGSGKGTLEIQTSADGETWETLETLKLADTQRYFKRTKASYESADEVYVRVAQTAGGTKAQVYDIYLLNNGEKSKAYNEETVGISNVKPVVVAVKAIYNLNGVRQQSLKRGLNIIVENGKARKVMVK